METYYNQQAFNYGKLGKLIAGRDKLILHNRGLKELKNARPSVQGALIKRKGTKFVKEVKTSSKKVRLIKFIFSEIDSFVLEFGDLYARFYQGDTQVGAPYEVVSPYAEADLPNIKYAQLGDIMYLTHPNYPPYKLTRIANTNWTLTAVDNKFGAVQDFNETATTITLSGTLTTGGTSTWTASASLFVASDVGTVWAIAKSSDKTIVGYAKMASYSSATVATFTNQTDLTPVTVSASINWKKPYWSASLGFPRAVAFHEQRLVFGGSASFPLTVWGSVSNGAYENFDIGTAQDDDAIVFELVGRVNTIQWLTSDNNFLVAGTYGGLAFVGSGNSNTPLTATNVKTRVGTSFGASGIQAVQVNTSIVYNHSNTKSLLKASYDDNFLQYTATDLNDFNTEILNNGTTYIDTIEQPDSAIACVSGGQLNILAYDEAQGVDGAPLIGWYEYVLDGEIEAVAVIPTTGDDRIWVVVKRTINGTTKRYVEYFENTDEIAYLDSYIKYSGTATRSFSGLSHLEGKEISVYGDGSFAGNYTVSSGAITIPTSKTAIEEAIIGLVYEVDIETMPINIPLPQTGGTTQSIKTRIIDVSLLLYQTLGVQIGNSFDALTPIEARNVTTTMTSAPALFANDYPEWKSILFNGFQKEQATICIRFSLPFPATLLSLMARIEVYNR